MSAVRLLREAMASQSPARLDLDTPSSLRTYVADVAMAAACARWPKDEAATKCASLVNDPG